MDDKDTSTTSTDDRGYLVVTDDRGYRITIKKNHVDLLGRVAAMFILGHSQFACSKCGGAVSVSKKKAAKLKKRKRVTILCKKCKKAQKARRRG